jgi:REG-2-like HAD superfamily hydrolase
VFDAAGTLLEVAGSVSAAYAWCASQAGARVEEADLGGIEHGFASAMRDAPPLAFGALEDPALEAAERGWWHAVARGALDAAGLLPRVDFDRFFDLAWRWFGSASAWRVFDDVRPTLRALQAAGVPLAVFSNWDRRLIPVLEAMSLDDFFARVVVSSALPAAKPDPAAYQAAADAFARSAPLWRGAPIMVGDRFDHDAAPALAAGWDAIWLDRHGHGAAKGDVHRVRTLAELPERLAAMEIA